MDKASRSATLDWTSEDQYWRDNFARRPYAGAADYSTWQPAYRYGYEASQRHRGRTWNEVEQDLSSGWNSYEHRGRSTWDQVKHAVRDAWERVTGRD